MVLSDVLPGADEAGECLGDPEDVDVELDELLQSLTFSVYLEIGHLIQCHFPRHCLCVCNASHCECPIVALQKKKKWHPFGITALYLDSPPALAWPQRGSTTRFRSFQRKPPPRDKAHAYHCAPHTCMEPKTHPETARCLKLGSHAWASRICNFAIWQISAHSTKHLGLDFRRSIRRIVVVSPRQHGGIVSASKAEQELEFASFYYHEF